MSVKLKLLACSLLLMAATGMNASASVIFVINNGQQPLGSVNVHFNKQTQQTNDKGQAVFDNVPLGETLNFEVVANGYQINSGEINVLEQEMLVFVTLEHIVSTVTFMINAPNAEVFFNGQLERSNEFGHATFTDVPTGCEQHFTVSKTGYRTESGTINVQAIREHVTIKLNEKRKMKDEAVLDIHPNPSQGTFYLKYSSPQKETITLIIKDISGQLIYHRCFEKSPGDLLSLIDLSNKTEGIYHLELQTGHKNLSQKLVLE